MSGESATGSTDLGHLRQCEEGFNAFEASADLESLVAAMRGREGSAKVQEAACLHVCRLAYRNLNGTDEGNRTRAGTAGAVEAVAAAMRAHEESAGVQAAACTH